MLREERSRGVDRELLMAKLSRLKEYLGYLRGLREIPYESFVGDYMAVGAAERYLQASIECMIDVGNEIIASLQLKRPERYRDIPYILSEAGVIPRSYADVMASMIGLRDLLVHDYASINLRLIHRYLRERLGDFEDFIRCIVEWMEGQS